MLLHYLAHVGCVFWDIMIIAAPVVFTLGVAIGIVGLIQGKENE
jgi:hypothetical protein